MKEVSAEDIPTELRDDKKKFDDNDRIMSNSLSKDEKDRIDSLKQNLKEKAVLHEKTDCKKVICEELRIKCLRCETCICKEIEESTGVVV